MARSHQGHASDVGVAGGGGELERDARPSTARGVEVAAEAEDVAQRLVPVAGRRSGPRTRRRPPARAGPAARAPSRSPRCHRCVRGSRATARPADAPARTAARGRARRRCEGLLEEQDEVDPAAQVAQLGDGDRQPQQLVERARWRRARSVHGAGRPGGRRTAGRPRLAGPRRAAVTSSARRAAHARAGRAGRVAPGSVARRVRPNARKVSSIPKRGGLPLDAGRRGSARPGRAARRRRRTPRRRRPARPGRRTPTRVEQEAPIVVEQAVGPGDDVVQGPVPGRGGGGRSGAATRRSGSSSEGIAQPAQPERERRAGGELEGERQAVEPPADLGDERRPRGSGAARPDRRRASGRRAAAPPRGRQRRDGQRRARRRPATARGW